MNNQPVSLDMQTFRMLYVSYKAYWIPFGIICVCFMLFFFVIYPQIQDYYSEQDAIKLEQGKVVILESNLRTISSLSSSKQDREVKTALTALPQGKDFSGVLYAIRSAGLSSGVAIGDFTFLVGELSTTSAKVKFLPTLSIDISLLTDLKGTSRFLKNLAQELPLAEVSEINVAKQNSRILLIFYYKPLPPIQQQYDSKLAPFSILDDTTLAILARWQKKVQAGDLPFNKVASEAASFSSE